MADPTVPERGPTGSFDANPSDELLDVVEPSGRWLGTAPRSRVHREGLWHQVFHCLIVRSGEPATVVLQRRRAGDERLGRKLDLSVTGHLGAGEQPLDGVREFGEELGVAIDPSRLVSLGRRLLVDDSGGVLNREIVHLFFVTDDTPLAEFELDPAEVSGLVEIAVADLVRLLDDPTASAQCIAVDTGGHLRNTVCRQADLVPAVDGYWLVVAVMAERFARHETPLGI